jgi:rubredoxin
MLIADAKRVLTHYMRKAAEGKQTAFDGDGAAEIAAAVDTIVDEAVEKTMTKLMGPRETRPAPTTPIPMRLHCPSCHALHVDKGLFASKPHHTHACQHCGNVWRPAIVETVGVEFLPGFKDGA